MQAIRTRYHGPTNTHGSRISARCEGGRLSTPYDHALNLDENHALAARALLAKLGWDSPRSEPMYAGVFDGDRYHVFAATHCRTN